MKTKLIDGRESRAESQADRHGLPRSFGIVRCRMLDVERSMFGSARCVIRWQLLAVPTSFPPCGLPSPLQKPCYNAGRMKEKLIDGPEFKAESQTDRHCRPRNFGTVRCWTLDVERSMFGSRPCSSRLRVKLSGQKQGKNRAKTAHKQGTFFPQVPVLQINWNFSHELSDFGPRVSLGFADSGSYLFRACPSKPRRSRVPRSAFRVPLVPDPS